MKHYKIKAKDITAVRKVISNAGYRNYHKEIASRVLYTPYKGIEETYNYELLGKDTLTDLYDMLMLNDLLGTFVEVNKESYICLDIWIYNNSEYHELTTTISVYIMVIKGKSKVMLDRPTNSDIIKFAVEIATNRK